LKTKAVQKEPPAAVKTPLAVSAEQNNGKVRQFGNFTANYFKPNLNRRGSLTKLELPTLKKLPETALSALATPMKPRTKTTVKPTAPKPTPSQAKPAIGVTPSKIVTKSVTTQTPVRDFSKTTVSSAVKAPVVDQAKNYRRMDTPMKQEINKNKKLFTPMAKTTTVSHTPSSRVKKSVSFNAETSFAGAARKSLPKTPVRSKTSTLPEEEEVAVPEVAPIIEDHVRFNILLN
jgi:hypothetical protein